MAAFGIVANTSIVATSMFNGVSQGSQPLFSELYGKGDKEAVKKIWKMAAVTALGLSLLIILLTKVFTLQIVDLFNSENNVQMAAYAVEGVRLYFPGFLFAGFNIVGAGYLSATESAGWAFVTSMVRGVVAISLCAVIMGALFGMAGVWLAFSAAECLTAILMVVAVRRGENR